jgi:uncharacterized protein with HEPN domain
MSEQEFMKNEMTQDAVIRNIEIIGEASYNVEVHRPEFATANPAFPLAFAYQMRTAVAHGYSTVDLKIVWTTIRDTLTLRSIVSRSARAWHVGTAERQIPTCQRGARASIGC